MTIMWSWYLMTLQYEWFHTGCRTERFPFKSAWFRPYSFGSIPSNPKWVGEHPNNFGDHFGMFTWLQKNDPQPYPSIEHPPSTMVWLKSINNCDYQPSSNHHYEQSFNQSLLTITINRWLTRWLTINDHQPSFNRQYKAWLTIFAITIIKQPGFHHDIPWLPSPLDTSQALAEESLNASVAPESSCGGMQMVCRVRERNHVDSCRYM